MAHTTLPPWRSVLAVVAHPDDESFGLGAILDAFVQAGARVHVLCLTRGEASTLQGVEGDLSQLREGELKEAARLLGAEGVTLLDFPDGELAEVGLSELTAPVTAAATTLRATGLIGFDSSGVSGHPDHVRATAAAIAAGAELDLPVLGWTLPATITEVLFQEFGVPFTGHTPGQIDIELSVDRTRQSEAVQAHPSQAVPGSVLWRRLELQGGTEYLRWLYRPDG